MEIALALHVFTSFFMTGLCWFVQIVHYPLFRKINLADFPQYERSNFVTGFVTVPVMIVELLLGILLLYLNFDLLFLINVVFLGIIGLSTFIFQVPIHLKLTNKASDELITRLIRTNWIRTISWTIRSGLLIYIILRLL